MQNIPITLLLISFFCCGLYILTEKGQLLGFIGLWYIGLSKLGKTLLKPVIGCVSCMASVWGTLIFFTLNGWVIGNWQLWLITIICAVFTNSLLYNLYDYIKNT